MPLKRQTLLRSISSDYEQEKNRSIQLGSAVPGDFLLHQNEEQLSGTCSTATRLDAHDTRGSSGPSMLPFPVVPLETLIKQRVLRCTPVGDFQMHGAVPVYCKA